jgi:hypothetical protein
MKLIQFLGNRILSLFVTDVVAGACVPDFDGHCCSTKRRQVCTGPCSGTRC